MQHNLLVSYLKVTIEMSTLSASKENLGGAKSRRWGKSEKKKEPSLGGSFNGILQPWVYKELSLDIKCFSEERVEGFAVLLVMLRLKVETVMHRLMMEAVMGSVGFAFYSWFAYYTAWKRIRWNHQEEGGDCSFSLRAADWLWERRLKTVGRARKKWKKRSKEQGGFCSSGDIVERIRGHTVRPTGDKKENFLGTMQRLFQPKQPSN